MLMPEATTTTTVTTITDREQAMLRGMSPRQVEWVGELKQQAVGAEVEKRAILAKSMEAGTTIGSCGAAGFIRGYYPDFMPAGFNPNLMIGVGLHSGAMYVAHEAQIKKDADLASYEPHLEHAGNGFLGGYAFEEFQEVGKRMRAAKAAKAAEAPKK